MTLALRDYQGREGALGAVETGLAAGCRRQLMGPDSRPRRVREYPS